MDWDILLDGTSIKGQVNSFEVSYSEEAYVNEISVNAIDPSFYKQFQFNALPELRLEVKVKKNTTWVSLGMFYVEQPSISANINSTICDGLWGRSITAKAGSPFAAKVSKSWDVNKTASQIITEMADLVDLDVDFEIDDYSVFSGTYSVDGVYPIDVIYELAGFAGATVGCTIDGNLVVRKGLFHLTTSDCTITDLEISDLTESVDYPEFGNRIKVSSEDSTVSLSVELVAENDDECLPADGVSKRKLYAFISDSYGPIDTGTVVTWSAEDGVSLLNEESSTCDIVLANKTHNANNYHTVTVDYSIKSITGIWAYSDRSHEDNFWNEDLKGCTFEDNEITVHNSFTYCDQTLIITYTTTGCAVNTVTAGSTALDVTVTAEVEGVQDAIDIKLGNTCACGSSLNAIKNTDSDICFGNMAPILIWAEINGGPATDIIASMTLTGCGELSSIKKTLATVGIINEIGYVINEIADTSQVEISIYPDDSSTPKVYLVTDTNKNDNLYFNHEDKTIDLSGEINTGTEVWIDYTADGAAAVSWDTDGIEDECDAEVLIKIADGTEKGLSTTVSISTVDCSDEDEDEDETDSPYYSTSDPSTFDSAGSDGGSSSIAETNACIIACGDDAGCITKCFHDSAAGLDGCGIAVLNRMSNIDNATPETKDGIRFSTSSQTDCSADDPYGCPCADMCESEFYVKGNTYDYDKSVHETVIETYAKGTPEYNEEYARLREENLSECKEKCEEARENSCGCQMSGPDVMTPGETSEFICSDGTSQLYTMPENACGTITVAMGCCSKEIRSTNGKWEYVSSWTQNGCGTGSSYCYPYSFTQYDCSYIIENGGDKITGVNRVFYGTGCSCQPSAREGSCIVNNSNCGASPSLGYNNDQCSILPSTETQYRWVCDS